jgi:uncharacterized protein YqgC (DUF456 family)
MAEAVAVILMAVGLVGVVVPALPGGPLIFAGVVTLAWADGFDRVGWPALVVAGILLLLMWGVDVGAAMLGAKRYGASRWGIAGGFLGLLAGLPFGILGILAGPVIGAVALEWAKNKDLRKAAQVGKGTFIGFVLGAALKVALAFAMIGVAAVAYLW